MRYILKAKIRKMRLTKEIIEQGMSSRGGWNMQQLSLLGIRELKKGWKNRLIGIEVSEENINKFIALKNTHLKTTSNSNQLSI